MEYPHRVLLLWHNYVEWSWGVPEMALTKSNEIDYDRGGGGLINLSIEK